MKLYHGCGRIGENSTHRTWHYPRFQASAGGRRSYPPVDTILTRPPECKGYNCWIWPFWTKHGLAEAKGHRCSLAMSYTSSSSGTSFLPSSHHCSCEVALFLSHFNIFQGNWIGSWGWGEGDQLHVYSALWGRVLWKACDRLITSAVEALRGALQKCTKIQKSPFVFI